MILLSSKVLSTFKYLVHVIKRSLVDIAVNVLIIILILWSVHHSIIPLCTSSNAILLYRDIYPVLDKRLEVYRYLSTLYYGADLFQLEMTTATWYQILFLPLLYMLPTYGCYDIVTRVIILFLSFSTTYFCGLMIMGNRSSQSKKNEVLKRIITATIALVYTFNPFVFSISIDRLFMFSYSLLPLYFTLLYRSLYEFMVICKNDGYIPKRRMFKLSLIFAILLSLILAKTNVFVYTLGTTILIITFTSIVMIIRRGFAYIHRILKPILLFSLMTFALTILLNLHVSAISLLLLKVSGGPPGYDLNIDVIKLLAAQKNVYNTLTFQGGFWPPMDYSLHPFIAIILPLSLALLLIASLLEVRSSINRMLVAQYVLIVIVISGIIALSYYSPETYYAILIKELPKSIGWIFRTSERLHSIQMPLIIIIALVVFTYLVKKKSIGKKILIVTLLILLAIYISFNYVKVSDGYFASVYTPVYYPETWAEVVEFLEHNTDPKYNIILLPYTFNGYQWYNRPSWNIYPISINANIFYTNRIEEGLPYITALLSKNAIVNLMNCMKQLGIKYIVITKDVLSNNENVTMLIDSLRDQGYIKKILEVEPYYEVYELNQDIIIRKIDVASVIGFSDTFRCFNAPKISSFLTYSVFLPPGSMILDTKLSLDLIRELTSGIDNSAILIVPSTYTHYNVIEAWRSWAKGYFSDLLHADWHPYIAALGIENWQTDYGYGFVFTQGRLSVPSNLRVSDKDIFINWIFRDSKSCMLWKENTPAIQFDALQQISCDGGFLQVKLYNSTWGWKVISSPLIAVDPTHAYQFDIKIRGINAHNVHAKIFEFDSDKDVINVIYATGIGDNTFDWKDIVFNYVPSNDRVKYIQLQIWHGHLTDKPLPNIIMIDYVKVYDITRYTKPVTMDIPFNIAKDDYYKLFVRLFENIKGGVVRIYLDGKLIAEINTVNQLNKFVWKDLGIFRLESGNHVLTLENVKGFNAVNVFVLMPLNQYENLSKEFEEMISSKTIIYIFEAETDMFRSNDTEVVKDSKASNGEMLMLNLNASTWQRFEIIKDGYYMIAIRLKGNATIELDNMVFSVTTNSLGYVYMGPIQLSKGNHTIVIKSLDSKPVYLDVVWIYSVETLHPLTIEDLFANGERPANIVSFERLNPTLWRANIVSKKPFMLIFTESYDPLWEAYIYRDGRLVERIKPVPIYGVVNGFWINEAGNLTVVIRYIPQGWFEFGLKISGSIFVLSIFYLVWDWRRGRGDRWALMIERIFKKYPSKMMSYLRR